MTNAFFYYRCEGKKHQIQEYLRLSQKHYFESDCINNEKLIPWNAVCSESCLHGVDRGERLERV